MERRATVRRKCDEVRRREDTAIRDDGVRSRGEGRANKICTQRGVEWSDVEENEYRVRNNRDHHGRRNPRPRKKTETKNETWWDEEIEKEEIQESNTKTRQKTTPNPWEGSDGGEGTKERGGE